MNKNPLIIYHADCIDGFTAAWVAHRAIQLSDGIDCELFPAKYGDPVPLELAKNRRVLIFDFSYPREDLIDLDRVTPMLEVFDHHKSAAENCKDLDFCTFDMEKSGCMLAWDYFHPDRRAPGWIELIEDRDLWRFKINGTRAAHAYISTLPMELGSWDCLCNTRLGLVVELGNHILRYIESYIEKESREYALIQWAGADVVVLNLTHENASEMGHYLLQIYPIADFSMTYFQQGDGKWRYDLRARTHDSIDVSKIAAMFGGGGHKSAAGFVIDRLLTELIQGEEKC